MKLIHQQPSPGTYVWLDPESGTLAAIRQWAIDNQVESLIDFNDLHVTVLYSRVTLPVEHPDVIHFAKPIGFRSLGDEGAFVLELEAPTIIDRHQTLIQAGGTHDWDAFSPHMTLWTGPPMTLTLPNFMLAFEKEQSEPLDP